LTSRNLNAVSLHAEIHAFREVELQEAGRELTEGTARGRRLDQDLVRALGLLDHLLQGADLTLHPGRSRADKERRIGVWGRWLRSQDVGRQGQVAATAAFVHVGDRAAPLLVFDRDEEANADERLFVCPLDVDSDRAVESGFVGSKRDGGIRRGLARLNLTSGVPPSPLAPGFPRSNAGEGARWLVPVLPR